jgi:phosphoribosylformimino-5-aminoimidazole carboxamide ribotide isomerase
MDKFTVYPAIDLRQGRVVRLAQGDPDRETSYANEPRRVAERWCDAGAAWLHVVNLDGAFGEAGKANQEALRSVLNAPARVQFGGGLRDLDAIQTAFDLGVDRIVIGTAAVEQPALVRETLVRYGPDRVAVGVDAEDGIVKIRGWQDATDVMAEDLARTWEDMGGRWLIFTDVSRDGMGSGVNVAATAALAEAAGLAVIASGGVASAEDVVRVRSAGLSGVIIGRALYEGRIDLEALLEKLETEQG